MWQVALDVESNGLVVFDLDVVRDYFGKDLRLGDNLLKRFTTTDEGDSVLRHGVMMPILAIDDLTYDIIIRRDDEPSPVEEAWVRATNRFYNLRSHGSLIVSDLEAIMEWDEGRYGNHLEFVPGTFRVEIRAFADDQLELCGYELILTATKALEAVSANTAARMRLLRSPT